MLAELSYFSNGDLFGVNVDLAAHIDQFRLKFAQICQSRLISIILSLIDEFTNILIHFSKCYRALTKLKLRNNWTFA
jgi:hypothetical protein